MKNYLDENGYPGTIQSDGSYDGGDTAAIVGTIRALSPVMYLLYIPYSLEWGTPLRHLDHTKWYGQKDRFSRDQLLAVLCGTLNQFDIHEPFLYEAHKNKWFLTAWNTKGNGAMDMPNKLPDICGPEVWALWLRIRNPKWASAVLWLLDVQTLIGAIQWRWFTAATNRVTRNHMLVCLATKDHKPSITSRLACKINDWNDLVSRWEAHCDAVGEYPTADLFKAKIVGLK